VISKEAHVLTLFVSGEPRQTYRVDLGFNWIARKVQEGDDATPEGRYRIASRVPESTFHKALLLDYPNAEDRVEFDRARRHGDLPASPASGASSRFMGKGPRARLDQRVRCDDQRRHG